MAEPANEVLMEAASYDVRAVFDIALGIRKPWRLERVSLNKNESRLRVDLSFDELVEEVCPLCKVGRIKKLGYARRLWCHLNFFQYETYVAVTIPVSICDTASCIAHDETETAINTLFLDVLLMVSPFDIKHVLGTLLTCSGEQCGVPPS